MLTSLHVPVVIVSLLALGASKPTVLDKIRQLENSNSPLLVYPTQFTQDIVPKYVHSHNDYWREVPLLTALSYGIGSVEADVWLINGTLYVGHETQALTKARTFQALYIQPLLSILQDQNPATPFHSGQTGRNGVWDTDSGRSLQLIVEIKTDGDTTLPYVVEELQPLRDHGYLTTFEFGVLTPGPVTVVGTGLTPLEGVKKLSPRDFFYDGPLTKLTNTDDTTWNASLSPIASTDWGVVGWDGTSNSGVWDTDSGISLQLLVDIKTDGNQTLPYVISELQPLRDHGYLTTFENGVLTAGPVTVVGTGNTPLEGVKQLTKRDVFYDAPLTNLINTADTTWNASLSPTASTDYAVAVGWDGISPITSGQRSTIQNLVQHANSLGIRARFWDTPGWPVFARETIWKELLLSGDIWLNVDDLAAASSF